MHQEVLTIEMALHHHLQLNLAGADSGVKLWKHFNLTHTGKL